MQQRIIRIDDEVQLWAQDLGDPRNPALLLVMGAGASGLGWPDELVAALTKEYRVIRYDHRDTGRSTYSFDEHPYSVLDLAADVVAVLDAYEIQRAHVVGMSMGGMLTQLLMANHPERVISATLIGTCALSGRPLTNPDGSSTPADQLPGIDPKVLDLWARPVEDHGLEAELDRRVEHWRLLNGNQSTFDAEEFRALERRIIDHAGRYDSPMTHGRADHSGMDRTAELGRNQLPTLIISAGAEPVFPPAHARHMSQVIGNSRIVEVPAMGHALPLAVLPRLADAILTHTAQADDTP
ncbi:alpha/beta fold hydrolase [Streptomyces sp. NBC_01207]|uniref:alpha/beta fold hydrolase n=1 Tax=Streptomyces sp. NBC_01207 TaxID=2903772 RepID=UPI002E0F6FFB|nr:alpha/beta fold hydrolase [Streptomyces sp. NBC_01207]